MADGQAFPRLPVQLNQEYRVKLGKSFTFPKENAFHSIKYDFKPKSIDSSQPGRLKVKGDDHEVSVFLPVLQAESVEDVAVFRGSGKPCRKECILIINTDTGEAVLEKISNAVSLKGVRDLTKKKKFRSTSPAPTKSLPKSSSSTTVNQTLTPKNGGNTLSQTGKKVGKKSTKKNVKTEKQPTQNIDKQHTPSVGPTPPKAPPTSSFQQQSSSFLAILPTSISPIRSNNPTPEPPQLKKKRLSNSSRSNTDESSSSSSSDSDSDSEIDQSNTVLAPTHQFTNAPPTMAMPVFTTQPTTRYDNHGMNVLPAGNYGNLESQGGMTNPMGGASLSDSSSSSSSSSSSGSSDTDSSDDDDQPEAVQTIARPRSMSVLKRDLELSDSDDSD